MILFGVLLLLALPSAAAPQFSTSGSSVDLYDFVEVTVRSAPVQANPFTSAQLTGTLARAGDPPVNVDGFCDAPDGSVFRIRFMPARPGTYRYHLRFHSPAITAEYDGSFRATNGKRRGLVRVDPVYPAHFVWEGTGEHYFWNGLTTYALMGWSDDAYIRQIIDRAAQNKINRLRVTLNGPRVSDASRWYEPIVPSDKFRFLFGPWVASAPDRVSDPEWDVTRYDVAFWQKYERLVRYARDRDVVVSVIFFLDGADAGADPFGKAKAFGPDEQRYYRYAAARLAAYSNVMWDITNEWHLFRSAWWVERMGAYLKSADPYGHLASCHGRGEFPWMVSQWADFAMYQLWDESGGYAPMLERRRTQAKTGRVMPQVNEEYGYEDHYPVKWGGNRRPPARSADNRRRLAWQITMAGCYQTTGERANRGDGNPPATPGGWINGGFEPSMEMLKGYARMVEFFTSFDYWKLEPAPELTQGNLLVLAQPATKYVVYFPAGGGGAVTLAPGSYRSRWYNPRSGEWTPGPAADIRQPGGPWTVPTAPNTQDWALLIER